MKKREESPEKTFMGTRACAWKEEAHPPSPCSRAACAARPGRGSTCLPLQPRGCLEQSGISARVLGSSGTPVADGEVEVDEEVTRTQSPGTSTLQSWPEARKGRHVV